MGMNNHIIKEASPNVKIMGYNFYAEDIEGDEPYNRREMKFTSILGGTERVSPGEYVHREFSFSSTISYPKGKPDAYDTIFKKMQSKPVEVISSSMGGKFKAMIKIRKSYPSPNRIKVDVTVTEVPDKKSRIPGESFTVPKVKKIKAKNKVQSANSSEDSKKKSSKNKSKNKSVKKKNK